MTEQPKPASMNEQASVVPATEDNDTLIQQMIADVKAMGMDSAAAETCEAEDHMLITMPFPVQLHEAHAQLPSQLHEFLHVTDFGVSLNHPFSFVPATDMHRRLKIGNIVSRICARYAEFERFCAERDWEGAIFVVERPYRPQFLAEMIETHGLEMMLPIISPVWTDTERPHREWENWQFIWGEVEVIASAKRSSVIMNEDEKKFFAKLPSRFVIYRGFNVDDGEIGWSWTLDRAMAEWFARRLAHKDAVPRVATLKIEKSDALAYFQSRNENEIVINAETMCFDSVKIETLAAASTQVA